MIFTSPKSLCFQRGNDVCFTFIQIIIPTDIVKGLQYVSIRIDTLSCIGTTPIKYAES